MFSPFSIILMETVIHRLDLTPYVRLPLDGWSWRTDFRSRSLEPDETDGVMRRGVEPGE